MKALSINHPWAWLIVNGYKGVENRDWDTRYRGEFLVHAGKNFDEDALWFIEDNFPNIVLPSDYMWSSMMGGIVGKAIIINTIHIKDAHLVTKKDKPWFFGDYGFILDGAEPCDLKPCKGALGFFEPDYNSRYVEKKPVAKKEKQASPQTDLFKEQK